MLRSTSGEEGEDPLLRAGLTPRLALAGVVLALCAWPAAAGGQRELKLAEAVGLVHTLGWLSLSAFFAGAVVGWHSGPRGWIWGMRVAAAFEVVLACLLPNDWRMIRPWLPFLISGGLVMVGVGGLGGWLGSRARASRAA